MLVAAGALVLAALAGCSASAPAHTVAAPKASPAAAAPSAPSTPALSAPAESATPTATPSPTVDAAAAECATTPAGEKHIYVSISQQHLWACFGPTLFTNAPVTTGASALTNVHYATPIGTSRITGKSQNVVLAGRDIRGPWNDPVHYWMPFDGGIGFHDAPWQKFPLGSPLYTTQGSHGCVHTPLDVVAALYNWAPIGTLVTVQA
ncbi:L,D-transpeptidase [Curtobacterium ammoniigenes]|uniref:L,D-transpeptidase n=1 Tax=Curtobacterium ammoniigenes TaxID=395387 RepID=UPI0008364E5F|nr:L,D-transpeptidase [Curtobacterium ammoniigenes]